MVEVYSVKLKTFTFLPCVLKLLQCFSLLCTSHLQGEYEVEGWTEMICISYKYLIMFRVGENKLKCSESVLSKFEFDQKFAHIQLFQVTKIRYRGFPNPCVQYELFPTWTEIMLLSDLKSGKHMIYYLSHMKSFSLHRHMSGFSSDLSLQFLCPSHTRSGVTSSR